MKGKSTISTGRDPNPARDDAPRLTREIADRAELAIGGHVIREAKPRGRPRKLPGERKEAVSLRLSPAVLAHFRSAGDGWQTRIDEVLRTFVTRAEGQSASGINQGRAAKAVAENQTEFRHEQPRKRRSKT
ncbi:MAG TPA: BrnA antitoxin family protein [Allosphingosinicella sp.]